MERRRTGGGFLRRAAEFGTVFHPSLDGAVHVQRRATIGGQHTGAFAMDGKIADRRILAGGEAIEAEFDPQLSCGFTGSRQRRQHQRGKRCDRKSSSGFYVFNSLKYSVPTILPTDDIG